MGDGEAITAIDSVFEQLDNSQKEDVIAWFMSKYARGKFVHDDEQMPIENKSSAKKKSKPKKTSATSKKSKPTFSIDKSLDFHPKDMQSAKDFIKLKDPKSHLEKYVVSVFYIKNIISQSNVSIDLIYTFYKHSGWKLPADPTNMLYQTGSKGWLDTANSADIMITVSGENLIEHELPREKG